MPKTLTTDELTQKMQDTLMEYGLPIHYQNLATMVFPETHGMYLWRKEVKSAQARVRSVISRHPEIFTVDAGGIAWLVGQPDRR